MEHAPGRHDSLDALIDGALASYTSDAPRLGFEERLVARLDATDRKSQRRVHSAFLWAWGGAGVLAVSLAVLTILVIHAHRPGPAQSRLESTVASLPEAQGGARAVARDSAGPAKVAAARNAARRARLAHLGHLASPVDDADSVGLRELRAASRPAPEAPLTLEEKLLLRIAHKHDPQQFAMLNPEMRAKQEADDQAEFQQFVEQFIQEDRK